MKEELLLKFQLPEIEKLGMITYIVNYCYKKTGNKFSVSFHGSKGYLSNIEISAEGYQTKRNNIIWIENLRTQKGTLRKKEVQVFYCSKNGVRVSI